VLERDELLRQLLTALSARPEINAVYAFGGQVAGAVDLYSDIDLVICSDRPETTRCYYAHIFSTISPIRAQLVLVNKSDIYAAMCLLCDVAPYQKIDFSIVANIETQTHFGPFQVLYKNQKELEPAGPMNILPIENDLQNQLNDLLFSIPRFTKYLFRGDLCQYQRWQGVLNRALALLYEKHFAAQPPKLNSHQHQELYAVLPSVEKNKIAAIMPINGSLNLPDSFLKSIDLVVDLYREKATACDKIIDEDFVGYMQSFLADETRRFSQSI